MDWITRQPSESVSEIEPESSGTADSGAYALGDKFPRKINDSVYELYRPSTADVNIDIDIVFFHGLQLKQDATPYLSTWRSRDAERSLWPSKWLAEDHPTARILSIHYDESVEKFDSQEGELVSVARVHNTELAELNEHFECLRDAPWDIDITSMGEIVPSDMDGGRYVIVEEAAARHPGTFTVLQEDHFSICQPQERTNTSYKTLVDFILQVQQKRRNFSEDFGGDIQPLPKAQVGLLASWYEGEINKLFEEHQAIGLWGMGGIDEDSELKMHDHLRALGRKLARDEGRSDSIQHTSVYHISKMVQEKALYNEKLQQLDVWGAPSRSERSVLQKLMLYIWSLHFAPSISFRKMQNLRYLHVSGFTDISEGLRLELPESLVIFESRIPIESYSFQPNTQLAVLLLGDFRGRYLPDSFSNFKDSLQFLNLRAERLESLPESFSHLKMLRECALHCPLVRELPGSFGSLESLKKLMLECASLEWLPDSIYRLRELHMMELLNCRNLEELPIDIDCLENIQSLIIENDSGSSGRGKLQRLPDTLGNLPNLQRLSLEYTNVKELPSSIGELQCLEHLTVSNLQLQELPASLGRLEKLQVLKVSFSDLKELPASIGDLESLERLTVCSMRLQGLPSRLGGMAALQMLEVSLCRELTSFPDSLGELKALRELQISSCDELRSLPESVGRLEMLQRLTVERCAKLESLPESLGQLPALKRL
ncbi:hypothetical protein R1flu_014193 [Riccia fluitans]|uniref:Disease resistance R13L4/SHOC-2-like LRR domain-containing protein n=1 Tax=Riccia fluitans TaxID=41844 RepID=A0ABD1YFI9_9MARC